MIWNFQSIDTVLVMGGFLYKINHIRAIIHFILFFTRRGIYSGASSRETSTHSLRHSTAMENM